MPGFSEKECEACERCGAFIPITLTKFHRCSGSDTSKRPANIPLATWLQLRERAASSDLQQLDTLISRLDNIHVRTRVSSKPPPPAPKDSTRSTARLIAAAVALFVLLVVAGLLFITHK